MYEEILDQMQELLKDEVKNFGGDFGELEQAVMAMMMSFGKGLLKRLVNKNLNGYKGSSISCECDSSMKFVQHRPRNIHSLFGWIQIKRAYYHCRDCGAGLAPYDKSSGLGSEQLSPGLAKVCCLLAVDDSFAQTSRKLEELLGQKVSERTVERVVHQVGSVALGWQTRELVSFFQERKVPKAEAEPERLYVAVDGTTAHETDGWHEVKVGSIYWEDERFEKQKRYVGRFDKSKTFGWHVWLEACRCGLREADEVVFLGDGAPWIRNERRRHFGRSTFIIDWYHASEHIWDCGKVIFGEGIEATEKWSKERESWLWDGQTRKLLNDLQKQHKQHRGRKREELAKLHNYIRDNEQEMRYDVFRAKGYDIGSGAVEGACKHVVGKRLKQSGMIWSRTGCSATLALRLCWLNKSWDHLCSGKPLAA
ncbi:MAG: ISKra4 family transposase [Phycisphaerae bacterium]|nr:ISKra4 family transposase [Phycisphaerae bacterium]NIP56216.1 ISKra4 family transposase [Phycisphaerae bacterium]NIS54674.1 ISKra4 family transposase [Phycisphaerae bacterium]NIU12264.1 ISKra4 family transposase [Phycisphaerae bacterium]NIU60127.1 ISKra4 family transposase [Phycisphaerae bacterium]